MAAHYVYRCYDAAGRLVYVGQTKNAVNRIAQHRSAFWAADVVKVRVTVHRSPLAARAVERRAIREERPRFNYQGRWETRARWDRSDWIDYVRTVAGGVQVNRKHLDAVFFAYSAVYGEAHPMAEGIRQELAKLDAEMNARREKRKAEWDEARRRVEDDDRVSLLQHMVECATCRAEGQYSDTCPEMSEDLFAEEVA